VQYSSISVGGSKQITVVFLEDKRASDTGSSDSDGKVFKKEGCKFQNRPQTKFDPNEGSSMTGDQKKARQ